MRNFQNRLIQLLQDILEYIEELQELKPDHDLLVYADVFDNGMPSKAAAPDFYQEFTPTDGTNEDALVEYLAKLEDAVLEEHENALEQISADKEAEGSEEAVLVTHDTP